MLNTLQAQPVKVGQPLAVQPSNAPLTVPDAPRLALHERSASRQAFDAAVAQKQKQAEVSFIQTCKTAFHPEHLSGSVRNMPVQSLVRHIVVVAGHLCHTTMLCPMSLNMRAVTAMKCWSRLTK